MSAEQGDPSPEPAAPTAPDFDRLWDFADPAATEARFRSLLVGAEEQGDPTFLAELLTQIARAEGLQGRFDAADATLDGAATLLDQARPQARLRWLLERGRVRNSSGRAAEAVPLFEEAWRLGRATGADDLAVDAAHMLGIAAPPDQRLDWHRRAIDLAETSADPRAHRWLGSLLNNLGWTLHDAGAYDEALAAFERALTWREQQGRPVEIRIARWAVARCLRSLGRLEEALVLQQQLRTELDAAGGDDPYVDEELGECLLALGRTDDARPWFARAHAALSQDAWLAANEPDRIARLAELGSEERAS